MQRKGKQTTAGEEDAEQFERRGSALVRRPSRIEHNALHNRGMICVCQLSEHRRPPQLLARLPQEGDGIVHDHYYSVNRRGAECGCMVEGGPTWQRGRAASWQRLHTYHQQHYDPVDYYQWERGAPGSSHVGSRGPAGCSCVVKRPPSNDLQQWMRRRRDDAQQQHHHHCCCCCCWDHQCTHSCTTHPNSGPHYCAPVTPTLSKSLLSNRFHGPSAGAALLRHKDDADPAVETAGQLVGEDLDLYAVVAVPPAAAASSSSPFLHNQTSKRCLHKLHLLPRPPFPSTPHGLPFVLCHYCSRLLLLPPSTSATPLHLLTHAPSLIKLKCSSCLKVSKFSTRHFHRSTSSTTPSAGSPAAPPSSCASATPQMPSCDAPPPTPPNYTSEPPDGNGNGELTLDHNEVDYATREQLPEHGDSGGRETSNGICEPNEVDCTVKEQFREYGDCGAWETPDGICEGILVTNVGILVTNVGIESMASTQGDVHNIASPETTDMSSVQGWVDSHALEIECGSGVQLQEQQDDSHEEIQELDTHHRRPPLHEHFGYKNPLELFEKVFSSEDDEIRARSETNSLASSSSSSVNASRGASIKCASFHGQSPSMQGLRGSKSRDNSAVTRRDVKTEQEDAQRSLVGILKRGLREITVKGGQSSVKARVFVNGHMLSEAAIKQAEECAGKLRPGSYWYDCKAGFWGVEGGPCLGILPPFIEELSYPMSSKCSNGDTQVYVNGRELHSKDLTLLSQRGLSKKSGRAYALGFDGMILDETTGLELKPLGKLAPTVERKGKGFGMFTADTILRKTCDAHQIKPANTCD